MSEFDEIQPLLKFAAKFKLLERDQELQLIREAQTGDSKAMDKLVNHNLRLVVDIAKRPRYLNNGLSLEELVQEGITGVIRAVEKFDTNSGNKLSTYATTWIKQRIGRALENLSRTVRIPNHVQGKMTRIKWVYRELIEEGEEPTPEILSKRTGFEIEVVRELGRHLFQQVSLDQPCGDESIPLIHFVSSNETYQPEEVMESNWDDDYMSDLLDQLSPRDRDFITLKYGLLDTAQKKDKELAAMFNMKPSEVKKKHKEIIDKLKEMADGRYLNTSRVGTKDDLVDFIITEISDRLGVISILMEYFSQRFEYQVKFKPIVLLIKDLPSTVLHKLDRYEADNLAAMLKGKATFTVKRV